MSENDSLRPIYVGHRKFLGALDLVVSFYTQKCQFKCSFCNLPLQSYDGKINAEQINAQIDWVFASNFEKLQAFQQFSIGNEGSILDDKRFPLESLEYLLNKTFEMPSLKVISFETRPEYLKKEKFEQVRKLVPNMKLDVTIGFETQDNHLRQVILNKTISQKLFESKVALLGELGVSLTSYIMIKPSPTMTESEGVAEAIATIEYLKKLSIKYNVNVTAYLNATYAAKGTPLASALVANSYIPPRIQNVAEILLKTEHLGIPIYAGLWSEGNEVIAGNYEAHEDYDANLRKAIKKCNQQGNLEPLHAHFSPHNYATAN